MCIRDRYKMNAYVQKTNRSIKGQLTVGDSRIHTNCRGIIQNLVFLSNERVLTNQLTKGQQNATPSKRNKHIYIHTGSKHLKDKIIWGQRRRSFLPQKQFYSVTSACHFAIQVFAFSLIVETFSPAFQSRSRSPPAMSPPPLESSSSSSFSPKYCLLEMAFAPEKAPIFPESLEYFGSNDLEEMDFAFWNFCKSLLSIPLPLLAPLLEATVADLGSAAGFVQEAVSYTHLRAHETDSYLVCRLLLEKKKRGKRFFALDVLT
eukprot:TRINITY_DN229_c0_g1_i6.p1 TRINITY_DN229_c0_g1~~TRINITY_DN229_c0_g1_i6.p1  ORF type:complete len:261 (-),score=31.04 TRINITY_DN229_c0_g1_i6:18-800(-)